MGWNNRMDLREIVREVVDWIHLSQDREHWRLLVNTLKELGIP
jgi:hypothetical protein